MDISNNDISNNNYELDFSKSKIVLMIGSCGSGKSNATKFIILDNTINKKIFNFGLVFSQTKYNEDYKFIDDKYIVKGYDEEILKKYIKKLERIREEKKELPPANFLIFDDLLGLLDGNNPFLKNLFAVHRHLNLTIILCFQQLKVGLTILREIVNYAIIFGSKRKDTIEACFQEFGQLFDNYKEFREHFLKCTEERFVAMLYDASIQEKENNYLCIKFPLIENINYKLKFDVKKIKNENNNKK